MKKTILALSLPLFLNAITMPELFDALKSNPNTKLDEISVKEAQLGNDGAYAKLYPKITLFGRYDNYSTPTGSVPVPPNTLIGMVQNPEIGQPFSRNIYRIGGSFTMPLFVKSIYTYAKQAKMMKASFKAKKAINLLQNEAILVGTNANLQYLLALETSLKSKQNSLQETLGFINVKVKTGRAAASELYKINDALNEIDISLNSIELQRQKAYAQIEVLTGIKLEEPLFMQRHKTYEEGDYEALKQLRLKAQALKYGVKAEEEKLWWPTINADGKYTRNYSKAYNNSKDVYENYGQVGVIVAFSLLNKENYTQVDKARISVMKANTQIEKEQLALNAEARAMQISLKILDKSEVLYKNSVVNKEKLLKIAKVSYKNGRLSMEEYLRYEDDLVSQKAKLYKSQAVSWQTLMKLAIIYGNNIQEMIQ